MLSLRLRCGFLLLVGIGCSGEGPIKHPPLGNVSGTVTFKGEPLANAKVLFTPAVGRPAQGVTDDSGNFQLTTFKNGDGAAVGDHTVVVTKIGPPEGMSEAEFKEKQASAGPGAAVQGKSVIPEKYTMINTSPIKLTVEPGENLDMQVEVE